MEKILSGKICRDTLKESLRKEISKIKHKITLTVISVGSDEASKIYIKNKQKECESVGITCNHMHLSETTTTKLQKEIIKLNKDKKNHGILVQLPLPKNIDESIIINTIDPEKDVDGLTDYNIGKLINNKKCIIPCTAKGIIKLLDFYNINLEGKNVTIINRSKLIGKPLIPLLLSKNATPTICHTKTQNLKDHTKNADIIIIGVGKPNFLTKDMIKKGSIIIDVGINRSNGKICGDANFENIKNKAKYITPVPNGIGPMTVYEVLENTLECYKLQNNIKK